MSNPISTTEAEGIGDTYTIPAKGGRNMAVRPTNLTCACCGQSAGLWHQFFNQDDGFGICQACVDWIVERGDGDLIAEAYGVASIHRPAATVRPPETGATWPPERAPNTNLLVLDDRELATVMAALRLWQADLGALNRPVPVNAAIWAVATNEGAVSPLFAGEIDDLCERINK